MIRIIFVGKVKEPWLQEQVDEYVKRLGRFVRIQVDEVKDEKITGTDYEKIKKNEGQRIINLLNEDYCIALDVNGKELGSKEFATALKKAGDENKRLTFIVGGALGLSDEVLKHCRLRLSLSKMTFTNQMVRLLLVEQIYRAFTILAGMEYHK
jgi:23S rRNA (pseudouridine1915-N3)-methyltransferase